eukprot:9111849-Lingulodinium_polyedra.AAC.1
MRRAAARVQPGAFGGAPHAVGLAVEAARGRAGPGVGRRCCQIPEWEEGGWLTEAGWEAGQTEAPVQ